MICLGTPPLKPKILIGDRLRWHHQTPKSTKFVAFSIKKKPTSSSSTLQFRGKTRILMDGKSSSSEKENGMSVAERRALAIKRVTEEAAAGEDCLRDFSLFTTARGDTLFTQTWTPMSIKVRGVVVLLHGLNEHSGRYSDFAKQLNANGFKVFGMDWIGVANFPFEGPLVQNSNM